MAARMLYLVCFLAFCVEIKAQESITAVVQQVRLLNEEILQLKADVPRIEEKLAKDVEMSEVVIKDEVSKSILPDLIEDRVQTSFADLFQNTSLDEVIDSHVVSEVKDLKEKQDQLKRQLESLSEEVSEMRRERTENKDKLVKDLMDRIEALELHAQGKGESVEGKAKTGENASMVQEGQSDVLDYLLETTNKTSQRIDLLEDQQTTLINFKQTVGCNLEYGYRPTRTLSSRLLITTFHKSLTESDMLNLEGHELTTYPHLKINNILSTTYDPTNKQIVFSRSYPDGTYTIKMDGSGLSLLLVNISSYGMAVDEWSGLLFMTTYKPMESISKVSTNGEDFTYIADLRNKGNYPFAVAIDPERQMVYACNYDKIFSVDYNGDDLKVIFAGGNILGLALDLGRDVLYFSNEKTIMRMSLAGNSTEIIAQTDMISVNLRYYNNTVYISGKWSGNILGLDVRNDTLTTLATFERGTVISLFP